MRAGADQEEAAMRDYLYYLGSTDSSSLFEPGSLPD